MRKPVKIALFANRGSPQLKALQEIITEAGAKPLCFDIQLAGLGHPTVSIAHDGVSWGSERFDDIRSIHIRCTAPNTMPAPPPVLNEVTHAEYRTQYLREQGYSATIYSFFEQLRAQGKLVINPLTSAYIDHDTKGQLYEKLRAAGFSTPHTLLTNSHEAALSFLEQHGEAVVKPSVGVGSTRLVERQELLERGSDLNHAPCMFQERIRGETVRVHIVGDCVVLTLRILSDGQIDSRTATKGFEYLKLPDDEEEKIVRANRLLGLHYAAWDIIRSESGEYVYLDCNPGPYIMWIGPENVNTVFTALANYMIHFAETGSLEAASASVKPMTPR